MVREQRGLPAAVVGGPKERHMRQNRSQFDPAAPVPEGFVAKPAVPKSKHHTYFEFVENKNKKKKLEYKVTSKKAPPPGFEFVPMGNPDLTTACKEISREKDAMIFIVSTSKAGTSNHISGQTHRIGHHIRETIVEEAKASLAQFSQLPVIATNGEHEQIPESQEEYHAQADAALRDLFPRIPNTDRQAIIDHSFTRGVSTKGEQPVGLCQDMYLARRVQLAVLAHIRHVHTRYDQLLKETTWQNARKVVEQLCLDTLVQWRGDEETGRDQLDEILREVVVISDSETGDSEDESTEDNSAEEADLEPGVPGPSVARPSQPQTGLHTSEALQTSGPLAPRSEDMPLAMIDVDPQRPKSQRRNQRGFKRYRAWEEAIRRNRDRETQDYPTAMETDSVPYSTYPQQIPAHSVAPVQNIHRQPFVGSNGSRPATPPSQDTPIPSIEPISPPTMPPSFVRSMPPRAALDVQHAETWNQQHQYQANLPVRTNPPFMVTSGSSSQHPLEAPHHPINHYPVPYNTEVYHPHGSRQVYEAHPPGPNMPFQPDPWPLQGTTTARRIIMDVNRPGERSNPIVMEDRGGFYERVSQPEDHRVVALELPILVREVRRWSRPPEHYAPPRQYVSRHESPPMAQDYEMEGVEVYHLARDPTRVVPQWRPQYQPGPPAPNPAAGSNHRDYGAIHIRAVSQPASHLENQTGFPSPRRDVNQSSWGARDGQYAHAQNRGHGYRSPPIQSSPRRHRPRGNVIVLD